MHLVRLLTSGRDLLRTGELTIDVGDAREDLLAVKRGEVPWPEVERRMARLAEENDEAATRARPGQHCAPLHRNDHRLDTPTTTGAFMPTKTLRIPAADDLADVLRLLPRQRRAAPGGASPTSSTGTAPVIGLPQHIGEESRSAVFAQLMPMIEAHTTERVLSDADAYLDFLTAQPEVSAGPVAVTGCRIGGLLATRTAATQPGQVAALAAFHGPVGADGPDSLSKLTAEVHFGRAESDLTPEALRELNQALDAAGVGYTSET